MSTAVYPVLPGLMFGVTRSVLAPPVTIKTTPSRREFVARDATIPLYEYSLQYEFLRSAATYSELQTLVGFYNLRGGPFDSFRFTDDDDRQAVTQIFGVGNGSTTTFQLTRTFGGFSEAVTDLNGSASIFKDGAIQSSGYTVGATGVVTFSVAPGSGVVLTWSGYYYRRVRFSGDRMDTVKFMQNFWEAKRVVLLSKKP